MTWTLRLYDSDETEIGWVEIEPYDYEITHPDGVDIWNHVRYVLDKGENPAIRGVDYLTVAGTTFTTETYESLDVEGRDHAEWIESNVDEAEGVASTEITDE